MPIESMLLLGGAGFAASIILYFIAKRFNVKEDERIAVIESILPGANCGACGRKGCHDFAVACCNAASLDGFQCPGAGAAGMARIAKVLGLGNVASERKVATLLCNGTAENRIVKRNDRSIKSCRLASTLAMPENYCIWGCLGCGDCVAACQFGALATDPATGLPRIDTAKCTGCGACATACPQRIISIVPVKEGQPLVTVCCSNCAKGALARKMCTTACIGCGKCVRTCQQKAIVLTDNHAVINQDLCIGCGECVAGCPTHAIHITSIANA